MALFFASAVWFDRRTLRLPLIAASAALFAAVSLAAPHWWYVECGTSIASMQELVREGIGVFGKPEYGTPGTQLPIVDPLVDSNGNPLVDDPADLIVQSLPGACLLDSLPDDSGQGDAGSAPAWHGEAASCKSSGWRELLVTAGPSHPEADRSNPEQRWIAGVAGHAGYLILRLRYYPAWGVKVNGIPVTAMAERDRGLMAVPVPQGNVHVSVDWTTTGDVVAGRCVSGVALLLIAGLFFFERRLSRPLLSTGKASPSVSAKEPKLPTIEPKSPIPSMRPDRRNTPSSNPPKNARHK